MKTRYYLPVYTRYDSDGDVDGTFYFVRKRHQGLNLACDGGSFMNLDKHAQFTKAQMRRSIKKLYGDPTNAYLTRVTIYICKIIQALDKIDKPIADHVADSFFWDWDIIPTKKLIHMILKSGIDIHISLKQYIIDHKIPCKQSDAKFAKELDEECNEADHEKALTPDEAMSELDDLSKESDNDKLMSAKYFVPRLKKDLKIIKGKHIFKKK